MVMKSSSVTGAKVAKESTLLTINLYVEKSKTDNLISTQHKGIPISLNICVMSTRNRQKATEMFPCLNSSSVDTKSGLY